MSSSQDYNWIVGRRKDNGCLFDSWVVLVHIPNDLKQRAMNPATGQDAREEIVQIVRATLNSEAAERRGFSINIEAYDPDETIVYDSLEFSPNSEVYPT
jgi:hypothetical protein